MSEREKLFLRSMNEPFLPSVTSEMLFFLKDKGFFTAPASTKYHGNHEGGLFDHSLEVMRKLIFLTKLNGLEWSREESPYIIGMFHDLCKTDTYIHVIDPDPERPSWWEHNNECPLKGHGDKSIMILSTLMRLTEEEVMCIRYHMGAFTDKEEWNYYTRAVRKYPNVLWTHQADMLASQVAGI